MNRFALLEMTLVSLCLFAMSSAAAREMQRNQVVVAAAASLKEVMGERINRYAEVDPEVQIVMTYGGSGVLQRQIEQGAPVDVFLAASPTNMDALEKRGLIFEGTRRDLFGNELVIAVPMESELACSFGSLATQEVSRIAIGEPASVPVGSYAKEVFTSLGVFEAVRRKAVYAKDARQVLTYVERGEVEAGVVYSTDAAGSKKVKVVATAPEGTHAPIVYVGAVTTTGLHADSARKFLAWLCNEDGKKVFEKYGFIVDR